MRLEQSDCGEANQTAPPEEELAGKESLHNDRKGQDPKLKLIAVMSTSWVGPLKAGGVGGKEGGDGEKPFANFQEARQVSMIFSLTIPKAD